MKVVVYRQKQQINNNKKKDAKQKIKEKIENIFKIKIRRNDKKKLYFTNSQLLIGWSKKNNE